MTRYTDLSIHVRMAWNRQHIMNGGPKEATVPGWFLRVTRNEGYDDVVQEVQLQTEDVEAIAALVDSILAQRNNRSSGRVVPAVRSAVLERNTELKRRLDAAEAQAALIPNLRAQLEETDGR